MAAQQATIWETRTLDAMHAERQELWSRQWSHLWQDSAFYRDKFLDAGLREDRVPDLRDLSSLPVTFKEDIRESLDSAPPLGRHLAAPRD